MPYPYIPVVLAALVAAAGIARKAARCREINRAIDRAEGKGGVQ